MRPIWTSLRVIFEAGAQRTDRPEITRGDSMDSIKAFLMVTVTMPVWALIAIFIAGLVADLVLKAVAWELDTNKKLSQIDHELEQDNKELF